MGSGPGRWLWGERASAWWLLAAVAVLRSASFVFGILNIDECDFALVARTVHAGGLLYVDIADIKPPLAYLSFLPAAWLGDVPMRALAVLVAFATALLLRGAARRWTGDDRVGWAAAWCAVLAGLVEVPSVNAELLMNLPAAAALWCFVRARRGGGARHDLLAGLMAGLASMYKQQGGILLVALVLGLAGASLLARRRGGTSPGAAGRIALVVLGFALPWGVAVLAWWRLGHLDAFLDWTVWRNLRYVGTGATPPWGRLLASLAVCVLLAAPLPWWLALREAARPPDDVRLALVALLALTWIPVSAGGRFYEHYFLQFVPPLALLAAPQAVALAGRLAGAGRLRRAVVSVLVAGPVAGYLAFTFGRGLAGDYPGQNQTALAVARWIEANSAPGDRLFVWGHYSPLYCLSHRLPGTRYYATSVHMGNFDPEHLPAGFDPVPHHSRRDELLTVSDLERNRPALLVDTSPADLHRWSMFPIASFPDLAAEVAAHYRRVASPAGVDILRRNDPAGSAAGASPP